MLLRRASSISNPTPSISPTTTTDTISLVTRARALAYTPKTIKEAFGTTGIYPLSQRKVLSSSSRKITQTETPPASSSAPRTATSRDPEAVSRLVRNASQLVTRQTPRSLKLKALIEQFGRSAQGALAFQGLGEEMIRTLRPGAKDTSAAAAKDSCHLAKAKVVDSEGVVQMREDKLQKDAVKAPKIAKSGNKLLLQQQNQ